MAAKLLNLAMADGTSSCMHMNVTKQRSKMAEVVVVEYSERRHGTNILI